MKPKVDLPKPAPMNHCQWNYCLFFFLDIKLKDNPPSCNKIQTCIYIIGGAIFL